MPPQITNISQPIVGRFYLVPCIQSPTDLQGGFKAGDFIPVLGDKHSDPELGADFLHYHYDLRFISPARVRRISPTAVIAYKLDGKHTFPLPETQVTWLKRKCYIDHVFFPTSVMRLSPRDMLQPTYRDRKLDCGICPHRGVRVTQTPYKKGIRQCPAHGLLWKEETGELVTTAEFP